MKNNALISIIIPAYNAEKYIEKCLDSLLNQTYKNIEIIVVDDGSEDNTVNICKKINSKLINVIEQKNSGPSSARNRGLDLATGKYVMFVDADDYLSLDSIEMLISNIIPNSISKINFDYVKNGKIVQNDNKKYGMISSEEYIKGIENGIYLGSVWGTLFETKIINKLRFDTNTFFMEDMIFLVEYLKKIRKVIFTTGIYYYVQNPKSITVSNNRILKNIVSIDYSLQKVDTLLNNSHKIQFKKLISIEKELAKINNYKDLKEILNDAKFRNIISGIHYKNIPNRLYRFILFLYKKRNISIIYLLIKIRKIIKKMKNGE